MVNVGEYTSPMEPMGMWQRLAASIFRQVRHTDEHWHGVALGTDDDGMDTHWPNGILAQIHLEKPQRWHIGRVPKMDKKIGQCSFGGINNNYSYTHSMNVNFCWRKKNQKHDYSCNQSIGIQPPSATSTTLFLWVLIANNAVKHLHVWIAHGKKTSNSKRRLEDTWSILKSSKIQI